MRIGCDIVKASRIRRLRDNSTSTFRQSEMTGTNLFSLAAKFAAKEAFLKALGLGFDQFGPLDIWVEKKSSGEPYICVSEKMKEYLDFHRLGDIKLSISHDGEYAMAVVLIEELK